MKNEVKLEENRQLLLLKKYYEADEKNKIVTLRFYYDKASDLLNTCTSSFENPIFNDDALENINNVIQTIPAIFRVKIVFDINDYGGYNPKNIIQSFNDTLKLNQYSARRSRQKKHFIAVMLILFGVILLFAMVIGKNKNWFGEGTKVDVIAEIINITACVFVWEAVSMIFLERSEQRIFALRIRTRVRFKVLILM